MMMKVWSKTIAETREMMRKLVFGAIMGVQHRLVGTTANKNSQKLTLKTMAIFIMMVL
jgi:hypothetical protein